jgi:hypothetical protein
VTAAQNPQIIQKKFFMLLCSGTCWFVGPHTLIGLDAVEGEMRWRLLAPETNGYTACMDSVRFGRALGIGARLAAKTVANAVDAATSPNPSTAPSAIVQKDTTAAQAGRQAAQVTVRAAERTANTGRGIARGGRRFGESFWGHVKRLSGVLWLEFTGVFFGVFALYAGGGAWKTRGALHETALNHDAHVRFLLAAVMAGLFAYFCVTSFVRAGRKGKAR